MLDDLSTLLQSGWREQLINLPIQADLLASARKTQQEIRGKGPPVPGLSLQRVSSLFLTAPKEAEGHLGNNKKPNAGSYFKETVQMEKPIFKPLLLFPSKRFCSEAAEQSLNVDLASWCAELQRWEGFLPRMGTLSWEAAWVSF